MQIEETGIEGLLIITPKVFSDDRGYFFESFNEVKFKALTGLDIHWKQDNESMSAKGTLRGMHFQVPPHAQDKLVRVAKGSVYDVAVDLRPSSKTFGKSFGIELSAENKKQLFIPKGFAHGFQVLEEGSLFTYKCSEVYNADSDRALRWDDPEFGIQWPIPEPLLSHKDRNAPFLKDFINPFK